MIQNPAIYNVRLVTLYLKLLSERYPHVRVNEILDYAGLEPYEITDEGHWITQEQIDRFYEKIVQMTGNANIAREAGRLAASPGSIGIMRQYTLGLLGPARAFAVINKATKNFTLSSEYHSRQLRNNSVEITVKPNEGIEEKLYQCENRIGFFEAIVSGFNLSLPKVEHPECLFKGGEVCRYIVTWKQTFTTVAHKLRDGIVVASIIGLIAGSIYDSMVTFKYFILPAIIVSAVASLIVEILKRHEMSRSMANLWDTSERLTEQINTNSRNIQMTQEVGQALANKKSVEDVIRSVVQIMEKRLDFDQGAILLADLDKSRLEVRGAYGYTSQQIKDLESTVFSLDNPHSQGPFVLAFRQQKPFLVNYTQEVSDKLTPKSRKLIEKLGITSFLCCPIISEEESLGILAVTNQTSKRPLVKNDVSLLLGIAPVIGVALQNATLVEEVQTAFEKTLKILADSIDARDFLTAGHSEVVTEYAAGIAEELGCDEEYIQMIRIAALLHDYGKIGIPDSILKKDGRLTVEERDIINTHPAKTREILSQVPFRGIQTQIPLITGAHHERWDGSGYPDALKGEDIPLGARVLAAADFFEAITSKRHYRDPMPMDVALRLLQEESGKYLDPQVVKAFLRYLRFRKFCPVNDEKFEISLAAHRQSPRIEFRTQVSARCNRRVVSGNMVDISVNGAYISSVDSVEEKSPVVLTFTPPGADELVQIQAIVAWVNNNRIPVSSKHPAGFGLQFNNVPERVKNLLEDFVSKNNPTSANQN